MSFLLSFKGFLLFITALLTIEADRKRQTSILVMHMRNVQLHKSSGKQHHFQPSVHGDLFFVVQQCLCCHISSLRQISGSLMIQRHVLMTPQLPDDILGASWHLRWWCWLTQTRLAAQGCMIQLMVLFWGHPGETGPKLHRSHWGFLA